jgi:hypothetical protein
MTTSDARPWCSHPLLQPTAWDQPKPEPCQMVGSCEHNLTCPVCGFGWGVYPCPCTPPAEVAAIIYRPRIGVWR